MGIPLIVISLAVEGAGDTREWKSFEGRYRALDDSPGAIVSGRFRPGGAPASGWVEFRNIKIRALQAETFPAYAALTSSASLSADGKTLFLIVFNKHHSDPIEAAVNLQGFAALSGKRWTVTGPSLDALNEESETVSETESGAAFSVTGGSFTRSFPPRSMTALELSAGGLTPRE